MSDKEVLITGEIAGTGAPWDAGTYQQVNTDDKQKEFEENGGSQTGASSETRGELVYTVEDAVETMGFGLFQFIVTIFCGLVWLADSMELMLLSVLSPAVKCQWNLHSYEEALITSVVFVGFFIGGLFWGVVCDQIGRKKGLLIVDFIILGFGVLSAIPVAHDDPDGKIPGYPWLLICRFGVGFGAGGTSQSVTYYAEFLPKKARGICITLIEVWWAIGSMFGALLAFLVMEPLGWHWFLGLATLPLALVLPVFILVPESARYYIVQGKMDKAQKVIERIAWFNCKPVPKGRIVSQEEKERLEAEATTAVYPYVSDDERAPLLKDQSTLVQTNGTTDSEEKHAMRGEEAVLWEKIKLRVRKQLQMFTTLFTNNMWKTTVLLLLIWLGVSWLYYGVVLLTTTLLQYEPHCHIGTDTNNTNSSCTQLSQGDYVKILWTSAAELPGVLITMVIIEIIGRKLTIASEFVVTSAGFLLLFICANTYVVTFFLFLIRAFATGVFQAVYVYTPEVYPTNIRGSAMGLCTAAARIGALITPFVAQVLLHTNDYAVFSLYAGSGFFLAIAAILLPIETKGRSMKDGGH